MRFVDFFLALAAKVTKLTIDTDCFDEFKLQLIKSLAAGEFDGDLRAMITMTQNMAELWSKADSSGMKRDTFIEEVVKRIRFIPSIDSLEDLKLLLKM